MYIYIYNLSYLASQIQWIFVLSVDVIFGVCFFVFVFALLFCLQGMLEVLRCSVRLAQITTSELCFSTKSTTPEHTEGGKPAQRPKKRSLTSHTTPFSNVLHDFAKPNVVHVVHMIMPSWPFPRRNF